MLIQKFSFPRVHVATIFLMVALCTITAGCGKDYGVELHSVSGNVSLDGKPLENATVEFRPEPGSEVKNRGAIGFTDSAGNYKLLFRDTEGCPEGKFVVMISTSSEFANGPQGMEDGASENAGTGASVPSRYQGPTSELRAIVESDGENAFDFELISD
ncbi:MAG: hypothetical protein AAF456_15505 [Planctomycetota bacterium]